MPYMPKAASFTPSSGHTGRVSHSVERGGKLPSAPSAVKIEGMQHFTSQGPKDFEVPQAMTVEEIRQTIANYGTAASNAMRAGFDGVELHAANGYLPQQFLSDSANQRTDEYGGSIANKARFTLEAMRAIIDAVGGDRVGIKISPLHPYAGIAFDDPVATYTHLLKELDGLFPLLPHYPQGGELALFRPLISKTLIAGTGYTRDSAEAELEAGNADLVAFGATFLANPDLPRRFELGAELNQPDRGTMFGGGEHGYTDYPVLA